MSPCRWLDCVGVLTGGPEDKDPRWEAVADCAGVVGY